MTAGRHHPKNRSPKRIGTRPSRIGAQLSRIEAQPSRFVFRGGARGREQGAGSKGQIARGREQGQPSRVRARPSRIGARPSRFRSATWLGVARRGARCGSAMRGVGQGGRTTDQGRRSGLGVAQRDSFGCCWHLGEDARRRERPDGRTRRCSMHHGCRFGRRARGRRRRRRP